MVAVSGDNDGGKVVTEGGDDGGNANNGGSWRSGDDVCLDLSS